MTVGHDPRDIISLADEREELKKQLGEVREAFRTADAGAKRVPSLLAELDRATAKAKELRDKLNERAAEAGELEKTVRQQQAELRQRDDQIAKLSEELASIADAREEIADAEEAKARAEQLSARAEQRLEQIKSERNVLREIADKYDHLVGLGIVRE